MSDDTTREAPRRRFGFTEDDDTIAKIMMARWADPDVEGKPVGAGTVASFADMARAVRESDWLAAHVAAAVAEAREMAELSWQSQVKKYADLVEDYQESIDRVQESAAERISRARAEVAERDAEIERLRVWKAEASEVLSGWRRVHAALGSPGRLGELTSEASLVEAEWLTAGLRAVAALAEACRPREVTDAETGERLTAVPVVGYSELATIVNRRVT